MARSSSQLLCRVGYVRFILRPEWMHESVALVTATRLFKIGPSTNALGIAVAVVWTVSCSEQSECVMPGRCL